MINEKPRKATENISIVGEKELKELIKREGLLRGHSLSQAGLEILKLGLPLYLEQIPPKYALTEIDTREEQVA